MPPFPCFVGGVRPLSLPSVETLYEFVVEKCSTDCIQLPVFKSFAWLPVAVRGGLNTSILPVFSILWLKTAWRSVEESPAGQSQLPEIWKLLYFSTWGGAAVGVLRGNGPEVKLVSEL